MFSNRRYLIIPVDILDTVDFNQVHETSVETVRKSIDGTKTFVKYDVSIVEEDYTSTNINSETGEEFTTITKAGIYGRPSIYSETYNELTHSEILELLATEEWSEVIQNIE